MDTAESEKKEESVDREDSSSGNDLIIHPFNPNDIEIETPPFTIGYLVDHIAHKEINMNTDFQREGNLWSEEQQSRLIESILLGLPLPAFYFDTSNPQWEIIDGLQRCCSIENFCVKKTLKLKGLEFLAYLPDKSPHLEGLGFDDLDRQMQRSILMRPITVNKIKKASEHVRYILFRRLNTGGLELTPPEMRHAIFQGIPAETIKKLAQLDSFALATSKSIPSKRMEDRDFASRFVAFYLTPYTAYEPSLESFINSNLNKLKNIDTEKLSSDFDRALRLAYEIFGDEAFRKRLSTKDRRKPINKAYFEVITVSFAQLSPEQSKALLQQKDLLLANLMVLMNNLRYNNALSGGTGSRDSVHTRFSWFAETLQKTLLGKKISINDDNAIEDSEF